MLDKWLLVVIIVGCTALVFIVCFPIDFYLYRRRKKLSRGRQHLFLYRPQNALRAAEYHAQVSVDTFPGKYVECSDDEKLEEKKREKKNSFVRLMRLFQKKRSEEQALQQSFKLEQVVTEYQRMSGYQMPRMPSDSETPGMSLRDDEMSDIEKKPRTKSRKSSANVLLKSHRIHESMDSNEGYGTTDDEQRSSIHNVNTYGHVTNANMIQTCHIEKVSMGETQDENVLVNLQTKPANYGSLHNVNISGDNEINIPPKEVVIPRVTCEGHTENGQAYISRDVNASDKGNIDHVQAYISGGADNSDSETNDDDSSDEDLAPYNADSDTNMRLRNRVNIDMELQHAHSDQNMAATARRPKHMALLGRKRNSVGPADNSCRITGRSQLDMSISYASNRSMSSPLIPQNVQLTPVTDPATKRKCQKILPKQPFSSLPYLPNEIDIVQHIEGHK